MLGNSPLFDNANDLVYKPQPERTPIVCPHCGKSHYQEGSSATTAIYVPTIIKDGKVVEQDNPNTTTTDCTCLECGKRFKIVEHKGKTEIRGI